MDAIRYFAMDYQKEVETQEFAHGGMPKKKVIHAHEVAKKSIPAFEKEYDNSKVDRKTIAKQIKMAHRGNEWVDFRERAFLRS